jgi:hypothetical protein
MEREERLANVTEDKAAKLCDIVVPSTLRIVRDLRRLPWEDVARKVVVPERSAGRINYRTEHRIQTGVAVSQRTKTGFDAAVKRIGKFLASHYDISGLIGDSGVVLDSDISTAGGRFLDRMIDIFIADRPIFPKITRKAVKKLCCRFHEQLSGGTLEIEEVYPVLRLHVPQRGIELKPGVWLRPATAEDLRHMHELSGHVVSSITRARLLEDTHCVLGLRHHVSGTALAHHPDSTTAPYLLRVLLILSGLGPAVIYGRWSQARGPNLYVGGLGFSSQWPGHDYPWYDAEHTLTASMSPRLRTLYQQLDDCPHAVTGAIPFRRLIAAYDRNSEVDVMIDLWVAMESLLKKDDEVTEAGYRMALRAARILRPADWEAFRKEFADAYRARSKLVHGATGRLKTKDRQMLDWTHDTLCQLLRYVVRKKSLLDIPVIERLMIYGAAHE